MLLLQLEYIEPDNGRLMPIDTRSNDLWRCQTMISLENSISGFKQQQATSMKFDSTATIPVLEPNIESRQGFPIQDPDGHIINPIYTNC
jgi:hypothetical protein